MHETFSPLEEAGTTALLHSTVTVFHSWTSPMYFKYHRVKKNSTRLLNQNAHLQEVAVCSWQHLQLHSRHTKYRNWRRNCSVNYS